jgi:hypothetical protein
MILVCLEDLFLKYVVAYYISQERNYMYNTFIISLILISATARGCHSSDIPLVEPRNIRSRY